MKLGWQQADLLGSQVHVEQQASPAQQYSWWTDQSPSQCQERALHYYRPMTHLFGSPSDGFGGQIKNATVWTLTSLSFTQVETCCGRGRKYPATPHEGVEGGLAHLAAQLAASQSLWDVSHLSILPSFFPWSLLPPHDPSSLDQGWHYVMALLISFTPGLQ